MAFLMKWFVNISDVRLNSTKPMAEGRIPGGT